MANPTPVVSVLIPAYRVSPYIAEALDSVFSQNFSHPFEVILVNDGSPDTAELEKAIAPFRDRLVYHVQPNGGPAGARNTAFRLSNAPLIALLDGDDAYLPDYLRTQMEFFAADPSLTLVYGDMQVFGGTPVDGQRLCQLNREVEAPSIESLIRTTATVLNTSMVRRDAILHAGGWDQMCAPCEDYDLWLRIAMNGKLERHTGLIARYRLRGDSLSSNPLRMYEARLRVYIKLRDNPALPSALAPLVQERIITTRGDIALGQGKEAFQHDDFVLAAAHLADAARLRRDKRLSLIALLLKVSPKLVHVLTRLRARLFPRYRDASAGL
ncbi:MAG TPA: glycosyltransferase family A protein [Bryobacteraceae bacterium]|jgi:glycosyltransferase involved in cell wall biosynthesis|nr:glycosyltransferase family A protein [Bryobacteraceae bacterium]